MVTFFETMIERNRREAGEAAARCLHVFLAQVRRCPCFHDRVRQACRLHFSMLELDLAHLGLLSQVSDFGDLLRRLHANEEPAWLETLSRVSAALGLPMTVAEVKPFVEALAAGEKTAWSRLLHHAADPAARRLFADAVP